MKIIMKMKIKAQANNLMKNKNYKFQTRKKKIKTNSINNICKNL